MTDDATNVKGNRLYKSSMFPHLILTQHKEREIASALLNRPIPDDVAVEDVTLTNVLFQGLVNDLALLIGNVLLLLIEHQSTINDNIAVRLLLYCARLFQAIEEYKTLYRKSRILFPTPEFIVLYNGKDPFPEKKIYKLSDSYWQQDWIASPPSLELTATVYNINDGQNPEIIAKSQTLKQYSQFVATVRSYETSGLNRTDAITKAVKECANRGILTDYLKQHGSEVLNMLTLEWDQDKALNDLYNEGVAIGEQRGMQIGEQRGMQIGEQRGRKEIITNLRRHMNDDEIAKITNISINEIRNTK